MTMFNDEKTTTLMQGVTNLLRVIGDDDKREGLIETPMRVVKAQAEIFAHTGEAQFDDFKLFSTTNDADMVIVESIPFYSMCEHHLLPFFGTVDVAYVPDGQIIGLSKIPRLIEWASRRPNVQEDLTHLISSEMNRIVAPKGVAVNVTARHMCMEMRGINQPGTQTNTAIYRGLLQTDTFLKESFTHRVNKH